MYKEYKLKAQGIKSLCWDKENLIDWASGGKRIQLDGQVTNSKFLLSYSFDSAITSPSGLYTVIYSKYQTKGLILKNGNIIREINRSYYFAESYDYPVTLCQLEDGREVIIHCPNKYYQLEIEVLETGEILTINDKRDPSDFFHSRLAISPDRRWLISAGWLWHPVELVGLYDLHIALDDPSKFDSAHPSTPESDGELTSAAFLDNNLLYVSTSDESFGNISEIPKNHPKDFSIALWSIEQSKFIRTIECGGPIGELMPISEQYVVSFYDHPKLWDMYSGELIKEWKHIDSGKQNGSITKNNEPIPPIAIDNLNKRFAVANENSIDVIEFEPYKNK
jgi:hypothetical protein